MVPTELKPKISVIIPLYNHAQYIREGILSVLDQTIQDFELIIINDGSTDNSEEGVKSITDPRIVYILQENRGAHAAINRGIKLAKGEYITILNSDDVYHKDRFQECLRILEADRNISAVFSYVDMIDGEGKYLRTIRGAEEYCWGNHTPESSFMGNGNLLLDLLAGNYLLTTSNLFCKKDVFSNIGFFENLRFAHDYDFFLRLCSRYPVAVIEKPFLSYRLHEGNTIKENETLVSFEVGLVFARFLLNGGLARSLGNKPLNYDTMTRFFNSLNTRMSDRLIMILVIFGMKRPELKNDLFRDLADDKENIFRNTCIESIRNSMEVIEAVQKFNLALAGKNEELAEQGRYIEEFRKELSGKNEALSEKDRQLSEHIHIINELRKEVTGRNEELAEQGRYIEEFRKELSGKNEALSEKDRQLSEHIHIIDELRKEVTGRNEELAEQGRYIEEFRKELSGKNEALSEMDRQLSEHILIIHEHRKELAEKGQKLQELLIETRNMEIKVREDVAALRSQLLSKDALLEQIKGELRAIKQTNAYKLWVALHNEPFSLRKLGKVAYFTAALFTPGVVKKTLLRAIERVRHLFAPPKDSKPAFEAYVVRLKYPVNKERPRVAHAIGNFLTGGSSRLVVDLVEHLGHLYEQEIITAYNPEPLNYIGIPVHVFYPLTTPDPVVAYMERFRPHLVHVHYWGYQDKPWYEKIVLAAEMLGCKIVENINTPVEPLLADGIARYVYVSNYVHGAFGQENEKSLVIHPGSNISLFTRKNLNKVPDDCIGMVYRLEYDKLDEESIDVFVKVAKRRPNTKILIVGGGPFVSLYREVAEKAGVLNCFTFTGLVSYSELPSLYKQMSIFVAPVWRESFGQVGPFAMSMGIPVVGYDVGALSEITDNKELLAPLRDSDRLAEIIIDLLDDRKKRLLIGETNQIRVRQLFSVEAMIDRYREIYQELLETRE